MILALYLSILLQPGIEDPNQFNNFLILGYVMMWLAFVVYIISIANKQRNTSQEVKMLRQLLTEDEESSES
jgi:L-cystine uptake protein TcyP (sodium:dicarboxylate symporter family)